MKICSVNGCGRRVDSHGFCPSHAARFRRHGNPLSGRVSPGIPATFLAKNVISSDTDDCITWPFNKSRGGYAVIRIGEKTVSVSRHVCEITNGAPSAGMDAAHLCGNGHLGCVNPRHIRWTDHAENCAHKEAHGTAQKGVKNPAAVLDEATVRAIMAIKGVASARLIAEQFGVSRETVSHIHNGRKWAHLFTDTRSGRSPRIP